jgi:benzodiazapine receptor
MDTQSEYQEMRRPVWAPPAKVFKPVWTALYILIGLVYAYIVWRFSKGEVSSMVIWALVFNLVANVLFMPIQFRLKNYSLAALDSTAVLLTLVWLMSEVHMYDPLVAYALVPYLVWVIFATLLQYAIAFLNGPFKPAPQTL